MELPNIAMDFKVICTVLMAERAKFLICVVLSFYLEMKQNFIIVPILGIFTSEIHKCKTLTTIM